MFWHGSAAGVVPGGLSFCVRTLILLRHFNAIFRLTWLFYGIKLDICACVRARQREPPRPASCRQLPPRPAIEKEALRHKMATGGQLRPVAATGGQLLPEIAP